MSIPSASQSSTAFFFLVFSLPTAWGGEELPKAWFTDVAAARQLAEKTDRPMLVVFRCTH